MIRTAPASSGKPKLKRRLDGAEHQLVEHLQGGGNDARADDVADGVGGVVDRLEDAEQGAIRLGVAGDAHPRLGRDAEGPLAADDDAGQVVAGVVLRRPADLDDLAVGQHELQTEDVVDRDAVLQRVRPAGVGGDVAADGAGPLARRVGGVVVARRLQVIGQPDVDDARLDHGVAVAEVDFEDPLHPRQGDHDAAADRQAAAGQARARPARQERDAVLVADLDDRDDLLGRGREDDDVGLVLLDGEAVAFVDEQVGQGGQHGVAADDGGKRIDQGGVSHRYHVKDCEFIWEGPLEPAWS